MRRTRLVPLLAVVLFTSACGPPRPSLPDAGALAGTQHYIHDAWATLTRSTRDLPEAARDPKVPHDPARPWPVYVSGSDDVEQVRRAMLAQLGAARAATIDIQPLPSDPDAIREHGLLYLPYPYVVPGGRFNEMYGWDSYFIEIGLLRDNEVARARDMVNDFVYEVERFGHVLNANRTYYLTRSQPPFLTRMVLELFERTGDRAWLGQVVPALDRDYAYWTTEPHLIPGLGLSRYFALGEGPAPEVVHGERDASGRNHYDRVREYYRTHAVSDYDVSRYYDRDHDQLTPLFFKGDRSMRESGFDPSDRFGMFGVDIIHYAPVCLNALLYRTEIDRAAIAGILADHAGEAAWRDRARLRRERIDRYLWDEAAGLYFDYNVETGRRRPYPFATTFYPLWTGAASRHQAERVRGNLSTFEAPGGVRTSTVVTGSQWDAPYGWAPLQIMAVRGLTAYGFQDESDRLATRFVSLVVSEFARTGTIVEKYDVERRTSQGASNLRFGYRSNEIGFGWTNAAVLDLLASLHHRP